MDFVLGGNVAANVKNANGHLNSGLVALDAQAPILAAGAGRLVS
jgi:hypothetical protein